MLANSRAKTPGNPQPCANTLLHARRPSVYRRSQSRHMSSAVRRKDAYKVNSLPEDGHHSPTDPLAPQETPEQWLVGKDHAVQPGAKRREKKLQVPYLGLEVTPELVAISMVYFVQGILGLSRLALSFFFKDDLGVEPAQVAVLVGLAGLPWVIKPLYGFISDSIPLFGYRRRSYLMLCGLAGSVSWLSLATVVNSPSTAVAAMLLSSFSTACSDVVVDSLVVERARGEPAATAGTLQSLCWASSAVGGIVSAYFSGSLVQDYGTHAVFGFTAVFPLIVSASALLIDEQRVTASPALAMTAATAAEDGRGLSEGAAAGNSSSSSWTGDIGSRMLVQAGALWGAVKQKHILLPTIFLFLWQATPTADSAMFYFYTNQLHFQPEFLGRVRLAGSVASLAGVALYNSFLKTVPLKKMLLGAMLLGTGLGSTQLLLISGANRALGLSDEIFVLGDSVILTALGQVSFMPILVLAARLCPEGVEATLFATLMSIVNGGSFVGSALGAGLTSTLGVTSTDFSNLFLLVTFCVMSTLLPAPFLGLLPSSLDQEPPADGADASSSTLAAGAVAGKQDSSSSKPSTRLTAGSSNSRIELSVKEDINRARTGQGVDLGPDEYAAPAGEVDEEVGLPLLQGRGGWSSSSSEQQTQENSRRVKGRSTAC